MAEASLRITLDIFSGRENPVVELTGKEAKEALAKLKPAQDISDSGKKLPKIPRLGYRGLIIEQTGEKAKNLPKTFRVANGDMFGSGLANRATDDTFEDYIFGSEGLFRDLHMDKSFLDTMDTERKDLGSLIAGSLIPLPKVVVPPKIVLPCSCAPLYEPTWWNSTSVRPSNNCYNYASNYRTNTFAQPGKASGAMYTALNCSSVKAGAVADCLIDSPSANNVCPSEGHLVALVIWPGVDYHWYRKGRNGYWSHKPGGTSATNLDNSVKTITDPRTCNRGNYTIFCTFMVVNHGHIKIK